MQCTEKGCPLRPGGLALTRELLAVAPINRGDIVLDLGCGCGETAREIRRQFQAEVYGVDVNPERIAQAKEQDPFSHFLCADGADLPFSAHTFHRVIAECTFSLLNDADLVMKEIGRTARAGHILYLSDLYRKRGKAVCGHGMIQNLYPREWFENLLKRHGYKILKIQDKSRYLQQMFGQMIFEMGLDRAAEAIGMEAGSQTYRDIGYLMIAAKKE